MTLSGAGYSTRPECLNFDTIPKTLRRGEYPVALRIALPNSSLGTRNRLLLLYSPTPMGLNRHEVIMQTKIKTILLVIACVFLWLLLQSVTGVPMKM